MARPRTLGAKKKMFYDSKMFHDVLLSFTIRRRAACQAAHDRPALALPAPHGYHEPGGNVRRRGRLIPAARTARGGQPIPSRPALHSFPADVS